MEGLIGLTHLKGQCLYTSCNSFVKIQGLTTSAEHRNTPWCGGPSSSKGRRKITSMLTDCGWPSPTGTSSQPTRKIIARKVTAALPITCAALGLMVLAACGGSDSQPQTPSPEQIERLSSRLAVMTLVVAVAREGRGAFDNFLPCVRRGVINYYNTEAGRHATFSNCDLGDGVSVHGDGELKWVWPELSMNRRTISRIMWAGSLTAVVDDNTPHFPYG